VPELSTIIWAFKTQLGMLSFETVVSSVWLSCGNFERPSGRDLLWLSCVWKF